MTIKNVKSNISIRLGLWTPTAEVLCYKCHGNIFHNTKNNQETDKFDDTVLTNSELEKMDTPIPLEEGKDITVCNKCGKSIQVYSEVANENNLMYEISKHNINSYLVQTGGGNSALEIPLKNGDYAWVTYDLSDDNNWMVCLYDKEGEYLNKHFATLDKNELLNYILNMDHLNK